MLSELYLDTELDDADYDRIAAVLLGSGYSRGQLEEILYRELHPDDAKPRVFERFYRAAPDVSGTGLGLGIVRELVEGWNGRIWFESTEGAGTTFFFTVPASPDV